MNEKTEKGKANNNEDLRKMLCQCHGEDCLICIVQGG